jgi:hypothetical protein
LDNETLDFLHDSFAELVNRCGFVRVNEFRDDQVFFTEFQSDIFGIRLEKYRREIYPTVFKVGHRKDYINLYNLLRFLQIPFAEFTYQRGKFKETHELELYYPKQIEHISETILENLNPLIGFFKEEDYKEKVDRIREFMIDRYPEVFKRADRI